MGEAAYNVCGDGRDAGCGSTAADPRRTAFPQYDARHVSERHLTLHPPNNPVND